MQQGDHQQHVYGCSSLSLIFNLHLLCPPCAVTFSWWGDCVPQWPR